MRRQAILLALPALLLTLACDAGDDGTSPDGTPNLIGTYVGDYTVSTEPAKVYSAGLKLLQVVTDVRGQLTTDAPRTAQVSLTIDGSTLTGGLTFTDDCMGWAEVTATIRDGGDRIVAGYSASDCSGQYTGTFDVVRRAGQFSPPTIAILRPIAGSSFAEGAPFAFEGAGTDPDGGGVTLRWRSSVDADLGTGTMIVRDDLSTGAHEISLIGIDDEVQIEERSTSVTIVEPSGSFALQFAGGQSTDTRDADDLDLAATFTIEMWIKPSDLTGTHHHMLSKWGIPQIAAYQLAITNENGRDRQLALGTRGTQNTFAYSSTPIEIDTWQHVAAVFDNGEARLYIDGQLDTVQAGMHVPQATSQAVSLGRERSPNQNWYKGLIDEVRIWNVARTAAEIAGNMNVTLTGTEPGLVAYWQLDEGEGDIAFDRTGYGHQMRLGDSSGPDAADPIWVSPGKFTALLAP